MKNIEYILTNNWLILSVIALIIFFVTNAFYGKLEEIVDLLKEKNNKTQP